METFYTLKDIPRNFKEVSLKFSGMISWKNCTTIFSTDMYQVADVKSRWRDSFNSMERRMEVNLLLK